MVKLTFLGGAREVGKSSILLESNGLQLIMDSGLKLDEPPTYPLPVEEVDALILSHAHLDHCGNIPTVFRQEHMPVYLTGVTQELSHMLQHDSLKIDKLKGHPLRYIDDDIEDLATKEKLVEYGREYTIPEGAIMTFYDAGHIPGSAGIQMEVDGKRVFYTGDTKATETRLQPAAEYPESTDVLICESTYGNRTHTDRRDVEREFLAEVESTLERDGIALIPAFAIGRAQELLLVLRDIGYDIYLDGMAKKASQTILNHEGCVKEYDKLHEVVSNSIWVKGRQMRKEITQKPCVIVTTAGMLEGGPVLDYLGRLHRDANSSVILTGYQVEDCNGRLLMDEGFIVDEISGRKFKVNMRLSQFDFSAHSDQKDLVKTIEAMKPEDVVLVHGDGESCETLASMLPGFNVHVPEIGESIDID
ncbi:MAG: MBL fold metallo-hydrolase [Candidatus Altiarchaeota archaeon]